MSYLNNPELKEQAAASAVRLARTLEGSAGPGVKTMMQQVMATTTDPDVKKTAAEIINAADVTFRGWRILGPFPLDNGGFDKDYGPEAGIEFSKSYPRAGGRPARWRPARIDPTGYVDLLRQVRR